MASLLSQNPWGHPPFHHHRDGHHEHSVQLDLLVLEQYLRVFTSVIYSFAIFSLVLARPPLECGFLGWLNRALLFFMLLGLIAVQIPLIVPREVSEDAVKKWFGFLKRPSGRTSLATYIALLLNGLEAPLAEAIGLLVVISGFADAGIYYAEAATRSEDGMESSPSNAALIETETTRRSEDGSESSLSTATFTEASAIMPAV
mmetsp:Transcript_34259/g.77409  ORF Transcript_34259/g.77409 Transcript_34259/m.77409 type:complete len:202 (+) Transcript_34259:136-741(+)